MANEYIKKEDAVSACQEGWNNSVQDCINNIKVLKPADVVSKADITALLEETEKELTKMSIESLRLIFLFLQLSESSSARLT